jgi:hypothetical protein
MVHFEAARWLAGREQPGPLPSATGTSEDAANLLQAQGQAMREDAEEALRLAGGDLDHLGDQAALFLAQVHALGSLFVALQETPLWLYRPWTSRRIAMLEAYTGAVRRVHDEARQQPWWTPPPPSTRAAPGQLPHPLLDGIFPGTAIAELERARQLWAEQGGVPGPGRPGQAELERPGQAELERRRDIYIAKFRELRSRVAGIPSSDRPRGLTKAFALFRDFDLEVAEQERNPRLLTEDWVYRELGSRFAELGAMFAEFGG